MEISETAEYLSDALWCQIWQSLGLALSFDLFDDEVGACQRREHRAFRLAVPVRRLVDRFAFNWGSIRESRFRQQGSDQGFKRWYVERGMAAEQLEKQVPAGRRRFENSRENKLASSQRLASVNW